MKFLIKFHYLNLVTEHNNRIVGIGGGESKNAKKKFEHKINVGFIFNVCRLVKKHFSTISKKSKNEHQQLKMRTPKQRTKEKN